MKTQVIDWTIVSISEAAAIFSSTFTGVHVLPNEECLKQLKKSTKFSHKTALEFVANDDNYETTTYSLTTPGGLPLFIEIDAETGDATVGFERVG